MGRVLVCGATDFGSIGRATGKDKAAANPALPNLTSPHVLSTLADVDVVFLAAGSAATHAVAIDAQGRVYTWGRNETGQLGVGDRLNRNAPTLVAGLEGKKAVHAACGKFHTVVCVEGGDAYAFGLNKAGQLGTGACKVSKTSKDDEVLETPQKCAVAGVVSVACGLDFSCWVTNEGELLTAGHPQHGVLGHGTDHEYNSKEGSVKLAWQPQPVPKVVMALKEAGAKVVKVACGHAHSVCVDHQGRIFTWGCGNYGCLGNKEQRDSFLPIMLSIQGGERNKCPPDCVVAAGSTSTFVSAQQGQLYYCGKIKTSGDNAMALKPFTDLSGWTCRSFTAGPATFGCSASDGGGGGGSSITWGAAHCGELGVPDKKTSAAPVKVPALEGMLVSHVACGNGFTAFLVDKEADSSKLPVWNPPKDVAGGDAETVAKRKAPAGASAASKKSK